MAVGHVLSPHRIVRIALRHTLGVSPRLVKEPELANADFSNIKTYGGPKYNQALAKGCTGLQTLVLDGCFQISKTALRSVGDGLRSLKRLSLARCPGLSQEGMSAVAKGCPNLTELNLPK